MTIWYVNSGAGGANNGTSETDAWTSIASAFTNVTTAGDIIWVAHTHAETLGADVSWTVHANHTAANPLKVYCVNFSTDTLTTGAVIGSQATSYGITISGNWVPNGIEFKIQGSGTKQISMQSNEYAKYENCIFNLATSSSSAACSIRLNGYPPVAGMIVTKNCQFKFGHTAHKLLINSAWESIGDNLSAGSAHPSILIEEEDNRGMQYINIVNADISNITGTIIKSGAWSNYTLLNCKMAASYTPCGTITNEHFQLTIVNSANGDEHYKFQHYSLTGSVSVSNSIYANDGAAYTGTSRFSWVVGSGSGASLNKPYVSPWIRVHHEGTSAITPYLECVRSGNATAYKDDEIWSEWSYQGTTGSPLGITVNDRLVDLTDSGADQTTGSLGASDWTGENATSWFGKLSPTSSITPAEIGYLMARVCVGKASVSDLYVDPQIRGRT